ncbi:MAG: hypothetical protein IKO60_01915, partial [Bacteroidaceae bacterium]|nr:hypothetical protein [Bacteroidaceae bacterium]
MLDILSPLQGLVLLTHLFRGFSPPSVIFRTSGAYSLNNNIPIPFPPFQFFSFSFLPFYFFTFSPFFLPFYFLLFHLFFCRVSSGEARFNGLFLVLLHLVPPKRR